jgi:uncharacterized peroxidase-related enzyme
MKSKALSKAIASVLLLAAAQWHQISCGFRGVFATCRDEVATFSVRKRCLRGSNDDQDIRDVFDVCDEKLGLVPNVLAAYSLRPQRLRNFMLLYNEVMLGSSGLSKLEREMVAVVVSSANRCYYCLVAHGQAVRKLSSDPELGEMLVMNYRVAKLSARHRSMLDFAWDLTLEPHRIGEPERDRLRQQGFSDDDIFDLCETIAFYNMSNRMASGIGMMPNEPYHAMDR